MLRLLVGEFKKLTSWGIILGGWSIFFFGRGGCGGGWENILDKCGWVGVSGGELLKLVLFESILSISLNIFTSLYGTKSKL